MSEYAPNGQELYESGCIDLGHKVLTCLATQHTPFVISLSVLNYSIFAVPVRREYWLVQLYMYLWPYCEREVDNFITGLDIYIRVEK